ncbi:MAG: RDD family protein [Thaumarchaeota archaeon]|nr:RDD family protein [Nitrososphaerota archaeon]
MPFCKNCGIAVNSEAKYCPNCGTEVFVSSKSVQQQFQPQGTASETWQSRRSIVGAYAGVADRFVAQLIDWLILGVVSALLALPLGLAALIGNPFGLVFAAPAYAAFTSVVGLVMPLSYFSYFESATGQTIGKSVMSIKVVDQANGSRIDFLRAVVRNVLRIVDFLPVFYIIGAILVLSTDKKQRIGDYAAGSVVVKMS